MTERSAGKGSAVPRDVAGLAAGRSRRQNSQRGSALILVTGSIALLIAFAIIAIDVPILLTTKGQLQSAADAAALAGASGLLAGSRDLAIQRAIEFASYNDALQETRVSVVITEADISFPAADIIRVQTHRTEGTGDALRTYFRRLVDPLNGNRADVTAVAEAQWYDVCGAKCLKPWAVPDRWDDTNANGVYDAGEPYEPGVTSYLAPRDVGTTITLKAGSPQDAIAPGNFFPVCYPPLDFPGGEPETGGDTYREWIAGCTPYTVGPGDRLLVQPGNMVGPTRQGFEDLIALDPNARWDVGTQTVTGSAWGMSPRIALVPFFDPTQPPTGGRDWVRITRVGVLFIEQMLGNEVRGRFMTINVPGIMCPPGSPGSMGAMVKGITLIQ
jgi:Flp pilus assembly protein TadG